MNRRYIASLAVTAMLTLAVGFVVRHQLRLAAPASHAVAPPSEASAFQQLSQEGQVRRLSAFLDERATRVAAVVDYVPATRTSGVRWRAGEIVVSASAEQPVAVLPTTSGDTARASSTSESITGEWALVVARRPNGGVISVAGIIGGRTRVNCGGHESNEFVMGVLVTDAFAGGGVFDLDGRLLGVVVRCGARVAALPTSEVRRLLAEADSPARNLRTRLGLAGQPLDTVARAHFGADSGFLITEVILHGAADRAGLMPGDILLQVDSATTRSVTAQSLDDAWTTDSHTVVFRRGTSRQTARLVAGERPADGSDGRTRNLGLTLAFQPVQSGVPIRAVRHGSVADSAGLRAGDRLVRVNDVAVESAAAARRLLDTAPATQRATWFIVFDRDSVRRGVLLRP